MGVPGDRTQLSKNDGVVSYSTIISISESPVMPGVVWAGTDDGNLQVSRDGGLTFTEVGKNLPGLPANHHVLDLADRRVALRCRRRPTSRWTGTAATTSSRTCSSRTTTARRGRASSTTCRRTGNVQVVREDPKNKDLLYVGHRVRAVRLDRRRQAVEEVHEQPADRARRRHPRAPARRRSDRRDARRAACGLPTTSRRCSSSRRRWRTRTCALFDIRPAIAYLNDQQRGQQMGGQKVFVGENAPRGTTISYYLKSAASGDVKITIADVNGRTIRTLDGTKDAGINRVTGTSRRRRRRAGQGGGRWRRRARRLRRGRRARHLHRDADGQRQDADQAASRSSQDQWLPSR